MTGKRVAYLTSVYPAPSHTFIRREVEALRARGIFIKTFSVRKPTAEARFCDRDLEALRTTSYLLPANPWFLLTTHLRAIATRPLAYVSTLREALHHRAPGSRTLIWSLFYFVEAVMLAAMLEAHGIDHLHNHFANQGADVGMLASHFLGIPWSMTLHGSADWTYPSGYVLPRKIEAATFVACVSWYGRAQAMRVSSQLQWDKMFVSRCGVDLRAFPVSRHSRERDRSLRIITVGRLSPEKGQVGLVKAFAAALNKGVNAELRIIGDGPEKGRLAQVIATLGLQDRCELAGQRTEEEVLVELAQADLFVLSSFMEGLPVVLIEALGMHVPVIAPCVAGIPELVRNGETGLLFPAGDWNTLTAQIERAARNPDLRSNLASNGHQLVLEEFDIHRAVQQIAKRFEPIAAAATATTEPVEQQT